MLRFGCASAAAWGEKGTGPQGAERRAIEWSEHPAAHGGWL